MTKRMILYMATLLVFCVLVYFVYDHFKDVKKKDLHNDYFLNAEINRSIGGIVNERKVYIIISQNEYVLDFEDNTVRDEFLSIEDFSLTMTLNDKNQLVGYLCSPMSYMPMVNGNFSKGDVLLEDSNSIVILLSDMSSDKFYSRLGHIDNLSNVVDTEYTVSFIID